MLNFKDFLNENFMQQDNNLEKNIISSVKDIIMQEEGISEKNFTYINAMNMSFDKFIINVRNDEEYYKDIQSFENKRINFAAEFVYDKYFKDKFKISQ